VAREREAVLYLVLKLVHVAAVMMFLGNITTGVFWKRNADRTRDARVIANAMDGIIRADRLFTIPGVVLIVAAGIATAVRGHLPLLRTGWILWSLVLFTASGWAFMAKLAPIQRQLLAVAKSGASDADSSWWASYETLSRGWDLWGAIALLLPLAAMALMILKPALPGFP
jgi:uncharacterized membrane protein